MKAPLVITKHLWSYHVVVNLENYAKIDILQKFTFNNWQYNNLEQRPTQAVKCKNKKICVTQQAMVSVIKQGLPVSHLYSLHNKSHPQQNFRLDTVLPKQ